MLKLKLYLSLQKFEFTLQIKYSKKYTGRLIPIMVLVF